MNAEHLQIINQSELLINKHIEVGSDDWKLHTGMIQFADELAKLRRCNSFYVKLVTMYSSFSKITGSNEKNHKLVNKQLKSYNLSSDDRKLTKRALKHLLHDEQINDEISEVVKDAKSLTYQSLDLPLSKIDRVRCDYAYSDGRLIAWNQTKLSGVLTGLRYDIKEALTDLGEDDAIHELRIAIRKLLSLVWLIEKGCFGVSLNTLNNIKSNLKRIFRYLNKSREYAVLLELASDLDEDILIKTARKKLKQSKKKLQMNLSEDEYQVIFDTIDALKMVAESIDLSHMSPKTVMHQYVDLLEGSNVESEDTLHEFRIEGKKYKYLDEMGLIKLDDDTYRLIKDLHHSLGVWHDAQVNRDITIAWVKNGKIDLSDKRLKRFLTHLDKISLKEIKKIDVKLFKLNKHLNMVR